MITFHPLYCLPRRWLLAGGLIALSATPGLAQTPAVAKSPGKPVDQAKQQQVQAVARQGMDDAKTLAAVKDVDGVEQVLGTLNRAKPGTAQWSLETAQQLMQLAEQMARDGRTSAVPPLVTRALQQLSQAESKAKDARLKASARTLTGILQERFQGDGAAAKNSYRAAVQFDPQAKSAQAALDRLEKSEANAVLKGGPGHQ
jgi:hypothetical protein